MTLSRRAMLAGMATVPASLLVGCGGAAGLPFTGEFVDPNFSAGHRIRSEAVEKSKQVVEVDVVIVGAGVAGLAAARRLKLQGIQSFVLLELENRPGGTSRSDRSELASFPWGAHYLPLPMKENRELLELLEEMEVLEGYTSGGEPIAAEQFLCRDPEERLCVDGLWSEGLYPFDQASPRDLEQLARFQREIGRWADWRDEAGRRAFAIPLEMSSTQAAVTQLDQISMREWLDREQFDSSRLRWLVDYSCRDDYGASIEQTSAWAGIFYFASRMEDSGSDSRPLLTWPEGNGRLVRYLHEQVAEQTELGTVVLEIRRDEAESLGAQHARWSVIADSVSQTEPTTEFHARAVIYAAPQFTVPYVIRGIDKRRQAIAREFIYGSWLVANVFLRERPEVHGFPLAWDNVIYQSPSLGYVVATHQMGLDYGPTIFTYYYAFCHQDPAIARDELFQLSWEEAAQVVVNDLRSAHPEIRSLIERMDICRWGHAMIQPRPGFIWGDARQESAQAMDGLHFAHTDLSGVALFEEAFYHGNRAAREVIDELS